MPATLDEALDRIDQIVDYLERGHLAHDKFDMTKINALAGLADTFASNGCGSAGCVYGGFPYIWPDDFVWVPADGRVSDDFGGVLRIGEEPDEDNGPGSDLDLAVADWLGISQQAIMALFYEMKFAGPSELMSEAEYARDHYGLTEEHGTRKQVAANFRKFRELAAAKCQTLEDLEAF